MCADKKTLQNQLLSQSFPKCERERPRERLHHVELLLAGPVLRRRLLRIVNVVHRDNDAGVCSLRRLRIIFPVNCFVYIEMH